jgi:phosphotransacetylase
MTKKRKPLSAVTALPETNEETMNAILNAVEDAPKAEPTKRGRPATVNEPLAHLGQRIDRALFDEMRIFVAKMKIVHRGYSIRTFLEEAIRDKLGETTEPQ